MNLFILIDEETPEDIAKGPGPYGFKQQPKPQAGPKQSFKPPSGGAKPKAAGGGPKTDAKAGVKALAGAGAKATGPLAQAQPKGGAAKPPGGNTASSGGESSATEGEGLGEGYVPWRGEGDPPPDNGWEQYTTKTGEQGYKRPKGYVGNDEPKEKGSKKEEEQPEDQVEQPPVDPQDVSDPLKEDDGTDVGTEDLSPDTSTDTVIDDPSEDAIPLTRKKDTSRDTVVDNEEDEAIPLTRKKEKPTETEGRTAITPPETSESTTPGDETKPQKEAKPKTTADNIKEAKEKISALESENKELKGTLKTIESDLSKADKKISSLDKKIEQKTAKLKEAHKKTNKSALRLSERKVAAKEKKIKDLQSRIDRDSARSKDLSEHQRSVLAKNKESLAATKKELKTLSSEHAKTKAAIDKADKDVVNLELELQEHKADKAAEEKGRDANKREHENVSANIAETEKQMKEHSGTANLSVPESDLEKLDSSSHRDKAANQLAIIDQHLASDPENEGLQQLRNIYAEQASIEHVPTKEDKDALKRADVFAKERGVHEPILQEDGTPPAPEMTTDQKMEHGMHTQKATGRSSRLARLLEDDPEHPQADAIRALQGVFDEQGALTGAVNHKDKAAVKRAEAYAAANGIELDEPGEEQPKEEKPTSRAEAEKKKREALSAFRSGEGAGEAVAAATNKPEGGGDVADVLSFGSRGVIGAGSKLLGGDKKGEGTEEETQESTDKTLTEVQEVENQDVGDGPRRPEKQKAARRESNRANEAPETEASKEPKLRETDESQPISEIDKDVPDNQRLDGSLGKPRKSQGDENTRKSMKLYISMNKAIGPRPNVSLNSTKLDEQKEADSEEMSSTGMIGTSGDPTDLPGNGRRMNEKGNKTTKDDKLVIKKSLFR